MCAPGRIRTFMCISTADPKSTGSNQFPHKGIILRPESGSNWQILVLQTNALFQLRHLTVYAEQVGYDPTPSDFQSAAMTTSATAPLVHLRENDGIRTHDQRSHNPLLYQLSYNLHNLWGERDLDPQSQTRKDLQSLRLPITGYLPIICLDDTTRTYARHYSMLRFPKPARFTNSSTSRL